MKKYARIFPALLITNMFVSFSVHAALTETQQNNIVEFSRDFVRDGNAAGLLQYGANQIYESSQLRLVYSDTNYMTINNKRTKRLWMMNPQGYKDYAAYSADLVNRTGGYLVPGNYLILDCSAFISLVFKHVFGLRFDYLYNNRLYVWPTSLYFDNPQVTTYNGMSTVPLFQELYFRASPTKFPFSIIPTENLQPGDIIIGRDETTDLGHIMMVTGNGNVIHSSSTPLINADGTVSPYLMREQALNTITNDSYTIMRVYRLSDGVLNPTFDGYPNRVDFSMLTKDVSRFDQTPPVIVDITVSENSDASNRKLIKITAKDEYGDNNVIRLASDSNVVMKSSGFGESGVLGYYIGASNKAPTDMVAGWNAIKSNTIDLYRAPGTYYVWVKDAANNLSTPRKIVVGDIAKAETSPFHTGDVSKTAVETGKTAGMDWVWTWVITVISFFVLLFAGRNMRRIRRVQKK